MKKINIVFSLLLVFFIPLGMKAQSAVIISDSVLSPFLHEWIDHPTSVRLEMSGISNTQYVRYHTTLMHDGTGRKIFETDVSKKCDTIFYEREDSATHIVIDTFVVIRTNLIDTLSSGSNIAYPIDFMRFSTLSLEDSIGSLVNENDKLPAGAYTLIINVYDSAYGTLVFDSIAKKIFVTAYQAPGLIGPFDEAYFYSAKTEEVVFQWYPVLPTPDISVSYKLIIKEFTDTNQSYYDAVVNGPHFIELNFTDTVDGTLPAAAANLLQVGHKYVWTILAININTSEYIGSNYGYAAPFLFTVTSNPSDTLPLHFYKKNTQNAACPFDGFESQNYFADGWKYYGVRHNYLKDVTSSMRPDGIFDITRVSPSAAGGFTFESAVTDFYFAGIPRVPNGGGSKSMRLGFPFFSSTAFDINAGQMMQKVITVTPANAKFKIHYAMVGEAYNYAYPDGAGFRFMVYKKYGMAGINLIPKAYGIVQANPFIQGGIGTIGDNRNLTGKNWTCKEIDLTKYIGQTVVLEIINSNCGVGYHGAYSYIDFCVADLVSADLQGPDTFCFHSSSYSMNGANSVNETEHAWELVELDASNHQLTDTKELWRYPLNQAGNFDFKAEYISRGREFKCNTSYIATLKVKDDCGLWKTSSKIIYINCIGEGLAGPDLCCSTGTCTLTLGSSPQLGLNYNWSPSACLSSSTSSQPTFTGASCSNWYNLMSKYVLTVTNASGCSSQDTVLIYQHKPISLSIDSQSVYCGVLLTANFVAGSTFYWTNNKNNSIDNRKQFFVSLGEGETVRYTLHVTNPCGWDTVSKEVTGRSRYWGPPDTLVWDDLTFPGKNLTFWQAQGYEGDPYAYNLTNYHLWFCDRSGAWKQVDEGDVYDGAHPTGFFNGEISWNVKDGGRRLADGVYVCYLDMGNCDLRWKNKEGVRKYTDYTCVKQTWLEKTLGQKQNCSLRINYDTLIFAGGRLFFLLTVTN